MHEARIPVRAIANSLGVSPTTVRRWHDWSRPGVPDDRPRQGRPTSYTEDDKQRIVAFYCQTKPLPGTGRWSLGWAAQHLETHPERIGTTPSKSTIHRILKANNLKPHRSAYFLHISDPHFFPKLEHLLELRKLEPKHLFFFDECPGLQVLKRLAPDMRTEQMRMRLEEFEYIRHGTLDLFAFYNHQDGTVYAECHANHQLPTFLNVFEKHVALWPQTEPLDYVMDNLASHSSYAFCQAVATHSGVRCPIEKELKTRAQRVAWLQSRDKRIAIHFTPYHGSWMNLVEHWFGIIGRSVFRESFDKPEQLRQAIDDFVEEWNTVLAHPFTWTYDGKDLHKKVVKRFTAMLNESAASLDMRFLIKELKLMSNLLRNYASEIAPKYWRAFAETFHARQSILLNRMREDDKPNRKKKAHQAFHTLLEDMALYRAESA